MNGADQEITHAANEDHGRNSPKQYWHNALLCFCPPLETPMQYRLFPGLFESLRPMQRIIFASDGLPSLAGALNEYHGRNASTSAAENRQETASNVQPGLALPAMIRPMRNSIRLTIGLCRSC
jgi:hypothetical protein